MTATSKKPYDKNYLAGLLRLKASKEATTSVKLDGQTFDESECCRHSLSCGGAILRIADGGKGICQNCANTIGNLQFVVRYDVKKAAQNEVSAATEEEKTEARQVLYPKQAVGWGMRLNPAECQKAIIERAAINIRRIKQQATEKARKEWEKEKLFAVEHRKCMYCQKVLCECRTGCPQEAVENAMKKLNASLEQTYREAKSQLSIQNKKKREAIANYMRGIEEAQRQVKAQMEE